MDKQAPAQLDICLGGYSEEGVREKNQDAFAVKLSNSYSEKKYKGIVATLADGVSCSSHGQQASQTSVTQFINDYYCTPESWNVKLSASKVLNSLNSWLYHHSKSNVRHNGLITTFSCIIFKSTTAHLFHVGDSRIYRYRDGVLKQLSHDHVRVLYAQNKVLTRGLGMDCNLDIDYQSVALQPDDIFLMSSDGVHDHLDDKALVRHLAELDGRQCEARDFEKYARKICTDALNKGSKDNLTCLLLKVKQLPSSDIEELFENSIHLTIPPALAKGNEIDNFEIEEIIHQGARSHVYLATDKITNKQHILKMPSLNFIDDKGYLEGFCKEQWVGQRLTHPSIMAILPRLKSSPFLYHICEYVQGVTLREWIAQNPQPTLESVHNIVKKIVAAVRILQRSSMVHRDLKPENIIISKNGGVTLIDFGTVHIDGLDEIAPSLVKNEPLGAVDYIAPEYLDGDQATSLSDLFSIAVMAYEMLSGELPYPATTSQSLQKARSSKWDYRPISQFRTDLPEWVDGVLKKATEPLVNKRYAAMSEFTSELFPTNKKLQNIPEQSSFMERNPLRFWQSLAFIFLSIALVELFFLI